MNLFKISVLKVCCYTCLLSLLLNQQVSAQFTNADGDLKYSRHYFDGTIFTAFERGEYLLNSEPATYTDFIVGLQGKIGMDIILKRIHEKSYLRLNWVRLGIFGGEGSGFILSPLHLGLGHQFRISEKFAIEPKCTGGLYIGTDDVIHPSLEFDYLVLPAVSFVFSNLISIELEYVHRRNFVGFSGQFNYLGLSLGMLM